MTARPTTRYQRRLGFTLIELIMTVTLIAVLVATASLEYSNVIRQTKIDKALADLRQLKKILLQYESQCDSPLTTYDEISQTPELQDMIGLVTLRMMPSVPADPWGGEYRLDIAHGVMSSAGENGMFDYDPATGNLKDDVVVFFKPAFSAEIARLGPAGYVVAVDFTRPINYTSLTTDTSFTLHGSVAPPAITTCIVDMLNRHRVNIRLVSPLPSGQWNVRVVDDGTIVATDTSPLPSLFELPIRR